MGNKKLIHNYILNTSYQLLVLIAPLITMPYVARVLGATNLGIFNYSQSIATYFVLIGAVGTTLYGQREIAYIQDDSFARSVVFWEIEIFRILSVTICTLIYYFVFCEKGRYPEIYAVLSLEVIATALDISWFFMGMEDFKLTVTRNAIIKLLGIVSVFLFVKKSDDLVIYAACTTLPLFVGNISLWFALKKYIVKTNLDFYSLFKGIGKRLRPIIILFLPQIAIDIYTVLDKTMIGVLASNIDQVGYYSQAQKIIKVVLTVVTSLGTVMLPAMSAAFSKGENERIAISIKKAFRFNYMLSFALAFGLCAVTPRFVPIYFGRGFDAVVPLMILISPIIVIIATSNIIGRQYLLPTNQQRAFTISIIIGAITNFLLNMLLIPIFDAIGASIATIIAEISVAITQLIYVRKQLEIRNYLLYGIRYGVLGMIMFIVVSAFDVILPQGNIGALMLMIVIGMGVYCGELIVTKDPLLQMVKGMLEH